MEFSQKAAGAAGCEPGGPFSGGRRGIFGNESVGQVKRRQDESTFTE